MHFLTLPAYMYVTADPTSVCPVDRQQQRWSAGLLLSALRAGDIDRQLSVPRTSCRRAQQQWRRGTALSGQR